VEVIMHRGIYHHWQKAREAAQQAWSGCYPGRGGEGCGGGAPEESYEASDPGGLGPAFGVRRPLRFMAHKLDLDEEQVQKLAQILNDLKTERAQAAVDDQRTVAAFADALEGERFDQAKADEGLQLRSASAERLRAAVRGALARTHAMLRPEQRVQLAYLLRSGALTI
jgi:Spy/CpxP family protein refolding chaperone